MILVIFDVDGTLVHSKDHQDSKSFATAYKQKFGQEFPGIDWRKYPHVTDTVIFNTVFEMHYNRLPAEEERTAFEELYMEILAANRNRWPDQFFEIPGARSMLEKLDTDDNFELAIATGGWKRPQQLKLEHVNITAHHLPFSGADGKVTREDILKEAVTLSGRTTESFERVVYVGDAIWDVRTTQNLNMSFVGIRHKEDYYVLEQMGARYVLKDYNNPDAFIDFVHQAVNHS